MVRKKKEIVSSYKLPEMLAKLMREHDLTLEGLGERSGVPRSTIGGWLHGVDPAKLHDVRKVVRTLGCSFEYLIFGPEEREAVTLPAKSIRSATFDNIHRITIEFIEQGPEK